MFNKLEYGHIQYIVCVFLNSWMSLYVKVGISSSSSSQKNVASFVSWSLKTIKTTPFFKISSLCSALHFLPFFSLKARRLKLFANCYVNSLIAFECLHPDKVALLSSLSLACLFTSLFLGLFSGIKTLWCWFFLHLSQLRFFIMFLDNYIHYA